MRRPDLGVYPPPSSSPPSDNFLSPTSYSLSSEFIPNFDSAKIPYSSLVDPFLCPCFDKTPFPIYSSLPSSSHCFSSLTRKTQTQSHKQKKKKKKETDSEILVSMQFEEKMHPQKMGFREYIEALEEERKKIQVFPRELPLSLELVTQAIEACKQQQLSGTTTEYNLNGQSECSEQTSMEEGFVFEEFIPMKKRASPDCDDEQHSSHKKNKNTTDKKKSDWLRSVQLWNPNPTSPKEDVPRKTNVVEVKRNGGAFQPFHKEEIAVGKTNESSACKAPTSPALPSTSSTGPVVESSKREEKGQGLRKQRRCWSQELHKRFLHALQQLGGADSATPKQIRELMNVDGLTNDEVKSHLQKFRLHTRRSPVIHNNGNSQTAPLFLVGNIFVQQPPEYAAAAGATTGELTTITSPTGIYAPVAAHPPAVPTVMKPRFKQLEVSEHSHSEERANHSEGAVLSNSPASSSSTHTPTTSPRS